MRVSVCVAGFCLGALLVGCAAPSEAPNRFGRDFYAPFPFFVVAPDLPSTFLTNGERSDIVVEYEVTSEGTVKSNRVVTPVPDDVATSLLKAHRLWVFSTVPPNRSGTCDLAGYLARQTLHLSRADGRLRMTLGEADMLRAGPSVRMARIAGESDATRDGDGDGDGPAVRLRHDPRPQVPDLALTEGISGIVVAVVNFDAQGRYASHRIAGANPPGVFEKAVSAAVRRYELERGTGVPLVACREFQFHVTL